MKEIFLKATGIDLNKSEKKIIFGFFQYINLSPAGLNEIGVGVTVYPHYGANGVLKWKNLRGQMINPTMTHIQEGYEGSEMKYEMWFEIDSVEWIIEKYNALLKKPSINVSNLKYEVEVDHFDWEAMFFTCTLDDFSSNYTSFEALVYGYVDAWNKKSPTISRPKGLIHLCDIKEKASGKVQIYMNMGSADYSFLRKFMVALNDFEGLKKMEISAEGELDLTNI